MKSLMIVKLLSLGLLLATVSANAREELAPQVTLAELKDLVDKKSATIIDANGITTYKSGHIPTAINYAQHQKDLKAALAWEEPAKEIKKLGYTNIKHFKGGLKGWKEAGYALNKAK